ncbi:hypothetical protein OC846_004108, partial [Tilletia horrida]
MEGLRLYLDICAKQASSKKKLLPDHLQRLAQHLTSGSRQLRLDKVERLKALFNALGADPNSDPETLISKTEYLCLPELASTNDREMIFYMFDAPLGAQQTRHYTREQTREIFRRYSWSPTAVRERAVDIVNTKQALVVWYPSPHGLLGSPPPSCRETLATSNTSATATLPPMDLDKSQGDRSLHAPESAASGSAAAELAVVPLPSDELLGSPPPSCRHIRAGTGFTSPAFC